MKSEIIMNEVESETKYKPFSNKRMAGFSLGGLVLGMMWSILGMVQLYAEKGLKLSIFYVFLILAVYAIWDAVNDPLTGYLLDKSKRFTSKYGKRFPFIVIGFIGSLCMLILMYLPITTNPIFAIIWLFLFLVAWDQFQTVAELSLNGLSVDIFRDKHQRAKYGSYNTILDNIGAIIRGISIPIALGLFGGASQPIAYFFMAVVLCLFMGIVLIPHLISVREPEDMIEFRSKLDQEGKSSSASFTEAMRKCLKDKNFMSFLLAFLMYTIYQLIIAIGIYYFVIDGLGLPVEAVLPFSVGYISVTIISVPFWMKIVKKIGPRKAYLYAVLVVSIPTPIFLILGWDYWPAVIFASIGGIGNAGMGVSIFPAYSEAIDNASVKSGIREEASYIGVLRFFNATGLLWQVLIFLIVATITGYNPNIDYDYDKGIKPSETARWGLMIQITVVPSALLLIGAIIFYKLNDITKEIALQNKKKLFEMGL